MNKFLKYLLLALPVLMISCDSTDPDPEMVGAFEGGVFVSNEGNFGSANGSLSFISTQGEVANNLYYAINGVQLGDVVQSAHIAGDQLFTVVNNSNKVEVVSLDSLHSVYTITDVALPRYMTSQSGVGYLTEWVSFTDPGRVTLFDLETGVIQKSITTGYGAEGVLVAGDRLFVTNSFTTTVSIINLTTEELIEQVEVGNSPSQLVLDGAGDVWVACSGGYDAEYNALNDGKLIELSQTGEILSTIDLQMNFNGKIAIDPAGDVIYFTKGTTIYSLLSERPQAPILVYELEQATSIYGIGVSGVGNIYLADPVGFSENGLVFVYNPDSGTVSRFEVGLGPNGFAFN